MTPVDLKAHRIALCQVAQGLRHLASAMPRAPWGSAATATQCVCDLLGAGYQPADAVDALRSYTDHLVAEARLRDDEDTQEIDLWDVDIEQG